MKGILFKPDMIRAIQEGRKTVTRRLVDFKSSDAHRVYKYVYPHPGGGFSFQDFPSPSGLASPICKTGKLPRYRPGEIVYVKEPHYAYGMWESNFDVTKWRFKQYRDFGIWFVDNKPKGLIVKHGHGDLGWYKRSPLFMSEEDARYFLTILDVRAERLQDIAIDEAKNEGIQDHVQWISKECLSDAISQYAVLWDSINQKTPWSSNPWIFRYEFEKAPCPDRKEKGNDNRNERAS